MSKIIARCLFIAVIAASAAFPALAEPILHQAKTIVSGDWDATDASGVANVFRYAFDEPEGELEIFGRIAFDENGHAVVTTPPLVNGAGFTFTVVASDNLDGTGNVSRYELHPSGETVIDETNKTARFFRLSATER